MADTRPTEECEARRIRAKRRNMRQCVDSRLCRLRGARENGSGNREQRTEFAADKPAAASNHLTSCRRCAWWNDGDGSNWRGRRSIRPDWANMLLNSDWRTAAAARRASCGNGVSRLKDRQRQETRNQVWNSGDLTKAVVGVVVETRWRFG